jgi:hypothetical protein
MIFHPILVSSINHIDTWADIVHNASWWRRRWGVFTIPPSFPHVVCLFYRIPVVFFANGTLSIESDMVSFTASCPRSFGVKYRNLLNELHFQLSAGDIKSIERYRNPRPFRRIEYYNINWVRVQTRENLFSGDFLLCVGGKGPFMGKIRRSTDELYEALLKLRTLQ